MMKGELWYCKKGADFSAPKQTAHGIASKIDLWEKSLIVYEVKKQILQHIFPIIIKSIILRMYKWIFFSE